MGIWTVVPCYYAPVGGVLTLQHFGNILWCHWVLVMTRKWNNSQSLCLIIPSKTPFSNNSKMAEQFLSSRCDELESEVQELREQAGFLCVVRTVGHMCCWMYTEPYLCVVRTTTQAFQTSNLASQRLSTDQ